MSNLMPSMIPAASLATSWPRTVSVLQVNRCQIAISLRNLINCEPTMKPWDRRTGLQDAKGTSSVVHPVSAAACRPNHVLLLPLPPGIGQ